MDGGVRRHTGVLAAWGRFAARRRLIVLFLAIDALILLAVVARGAGEGFADEFELPGVESQRALNLLNERFPARAGSSATLVFQSSSDLRAGDVRDRIEELLPAIAALPEILAVRSLYETGSQTISRDGTIGYATLQYGTRSRDIERSSIEALFEAADEFSSPELRVEVGGPAARSAEREPPGRSEAIGLLAAAIILLIAFGSIVSMGVPIVTALFGLGSSLLLLTVATRFITMSTFTPAFVAMIGIGVGIDYALFVVTRFREELGRGAEVEDAVGAAVDTAGRAVIFAGVAVVIALVSLFVVDFPLIAALGVAGAIVVGMSVIVALAVLPALLGFIGTGIDRWRLGVPKAKASADDSGFWYSVAQTVQNHALVSAVLASGLLLVAAIPVLDMRLGSADAGNGPTSFHSRRAYDLLSEGFGPGFNGPLLIAVEIPDGVDTAPLLGLQAAIAADDGVAFAGPPVPGPGGDAAVLTVFARTSPQDERTGELIERLRAEVIPAALAGTGMAAFVGGQTAVFDDMTAKIASRLPHFFALVIGLSFVLLMVVFRSFWVPLKAAVMNLLAIGAAYGTLVAVFQWGWLADFFGAGREGPIEPFIPMMLFAILFGLSMDYEVFLLSRIRENYVHGMSNRESVARGVGQTARVITAAAAIMISVFVSFALSEGRVIKQFGLGLSTAILMDATVVRLVLVPAVMGLLGDANWWFPRWLDRLLPRVQIEGHELPEEPMPIPVSAPQVTVDDPVPAGGLTPAGVAAPASAAPTPARRRPARDYMRPPDAVEAERSDGAAPPSDGDSPR